MLPPDNRSRLLYKCDNYICAALLVTYLHILFAYTILYILTYVLWETKLRPPERLLNSSAHVGPFRLLIFAPSIVISNTATDVSATLLFTMNEVVDLCVGVALYIAFVARLSYYS